MQFSHDSVIVPPAFGQKRRRVILKRRRVIFKRANGRVRTDDLPLTKRVLYR